MTIQPQKVQYKYDNTTAKSTIQVWQYNCKKYNMQLQKRMTIQLQKVQKVQYKYAKSTIQYNCKKYNTRMTIELQNVQSTYDNTTAKSTIHV